MELCAPTPVIKMASGADTMRHVLGILGLEDDQVKFLEKNRIRNLRSLLNNTEANYRTLVKEQQSPLMDVDVEELLLFERWYLDAYKKHGAKLTNDWITTNFTEIEWNDFCARDKLNQPAPQTTPVTQLPSIGLGATAKQTPQLKVSLKDYPITSGRAKDWAKYRRKFLAVASANGHDDILDPNYVVPSQALPVAYSAYKQLNEMTFAALQFGTADSIVRSKLEPFRSAKDGRGAYLALDKYQKGQGSEETCATNAYTDLTSLRLTSNFPGGVETFLAKWDEAIIKLEELGQRPNEFMERTFLKERILDPGYANTIDNLDMMVPAPSIETCKSEIRRQGAKLEKKRARTSFRKAHMTTHESEDLELMDDLEIAADEELEEHISDLERQISALNAQRNNNNRFSRQNSGYDSASRNSSGKSGAGDGFINKQSTSVWNIDRKAWAHMTPEQKRLWSNLKESA